MNDLKQKAFDILSGKIDPEINLLVDILTLADDEYHNKDGESFLSDAEYDTLEGYLRTLDPTNKKLIGVGAEVRGSKINLPYPMGGLDQVYSGETGTWIENIKAEKADVVISDKIDGTSAMIVYDDHGNLQIGYSRGSGRQAADITRHLKKITNIPQKVSRKMVVRGEIVLPEKKWKEIQSEVAKEKRLYKNPRNFTAGQMNSEIALDIFYKYAHFIGYTVIVPELDKTHEFQLLKDNKFELPGFTVVQGSNIKDEFLNDLIKNRKNESDYELDGVVLDIDQLSVKKNLKARESSINPPGSKKYKLGGDENKTLATVTNVHWRVSKTGYLKPRVEIVPVELVGVTIRYATGFNAKFILENNIGPGAIIEITRSGDVIPTILKVIKPMPIENMN